MSHVRKTARGKRSGSNYRREIARLRGPYKPHKSYMPEQVGFQSPKWGGASAFAISCGLGLAVAVVLGLALMVFIGHGGNVVSASGGGPSSGSVGYGSLNHPKGPCSNAGQGLCAAGDTGWFAVSCAWPTVT